MTTRSRSSFVGGSAPHRTFASVLRALTRCGLALGLCLTFPACSRISLGLGQDQPDLRIQVINRTNRIQEVVVVQDGARLFAGPVGPGENRDLGGVPLRKEWSRFGARRSGGEDKPVLVRRGTADQLMVYLDDRRPGGIGLHLEDR